MSNGAPTTDKRLDEILSRLRELEVSLAMWEARWNQLLPRLDRLEQRMGIVEDVISASDGSDAASPQT